jgi:hypothetical protein
MRERKKCMNEDKIELTIEITEGKRLHEEVPASPIFRSVDP